MLAELFRPKTGVLELPHAVSIFQLIALQRSFDRQPQLYGQLCQVRAPPLLLLKWGLREERAPH